MTAALETSKRHNLSDRFRFVCFECKKVSTFTTDKKVALNKRDQHNTKTHTTQG